MALVLPPGHVLKLTPCAGNLQVQNLIWLEWSCIHSNTAKMKCFDTSWGHLKPSGSHLGVIPPERAPTDPELTQTSSIAPQSQARWNARSDQVTTVISRVPIDRLPKQRMPMEMPRLLHVDAPEPMHAPTLQLV